MANTTDKTEIIIKKGEDNLTIDLPVEPNTLMNAIESMHNYMEDHLEIYQQEKSTLEEIKSRLKKALK